MVVQFPYTKVLGWNLGKCSWWVFVYSLCMHWFPLNTLTSQQSPKTRLLDYLVSLNCPHVQCLLGCLSCMSLWCLVIDWQPVQDVPRLLPNYCWRWALAPSCEVCFWYMAVNLAMIQSRAVYLPFIVLASTPQFISPCASSDISWLS